MNNSSLIDQPTGSLCVSVAIILNYNDWSLVKQTALTHIKNKVFEKIIIVDNNSIDNSYEELKKINSKDVHVIQSDRNGGYGYGNNFGVLYAISQFNPEYLVIMNPDVVVQSDSIQCCYNVLETDTTIGAVSPIMKNADGKICRNFAWKHLSFIQECINISTTSRLLLGEIYKTIYYDIKSVTKPYQLVGVVPGSLVVFRTRAFLDAGMYDENMFLFTEERAIAKRLLRIGYTTAICTDIFFTHYHSHTIGKTLNSYKAHLISLSSKLYFVQTYTEANSLQVFLFRILIVVSAIEFWLLLPIKNIYRFFDRKKILKKAST